MKFSIAVLMISLSFLSFRSVLADDGNKEPMVPVWRQQLSVAIDEFMNAWSEQAKLSEETQVRFRISGLDPRLKLSPCDETPHITTGRKFRAGKLTLKTECLSPHPWKIYVALELERLHPVVVSRASLPRGTAVTEQDLLIKQENIDRLNFGYFTQVEEVVGMITRRALQQGLPLTPNQLEPPRLISKGDSVLIEARNSRIRVKMPGLAMSDGRKGQQISVRNIQSQRLVRAEVIDNGVVRVPL